MWAKIYILFVGLLWGANLPLTSSQPVRGEILVCTLSGPQPDDVRIEWEADSPSDNTTGTLRAKIGNETLLTFSGADFGSHPQAVCQVSLRDFQTNVYESEDLYHAKHEETSLQQAQAVLTGMVIGRNASEVSVQWMKNALVEDHHVDTRVLKGTSKDSLLAFSQVVVPYSDWKNSTSYSCVFTYKAGTKKPKKESLGEK